MRHFPCSQCVIPIYMDTASHGRAVVGWDPPPKQGRKQVCQVVWGMEQWGSWLLPADGCRANEQSVLCLDLKLLSFLILLSSVVCLWLLWSALAPGRRRFRRVGSSSPYSWLCITKMRPFVQMGSFGASVLWGRVCCSAVQGTVDQCYLSFYPSF